jgi:hypothetical protein
LAENSLPLRWRRAPREEHSSNSRGESSERVFPRRQPSSPGISSISWAWPFDVTVNRRKFRILLGVRDEHSSNPKVARGC